MNISTDTESISHEGIVQKINDKSVIVKILTGTACSGCHAKGSCNLSETEEKIIEVSGSYDVNPGDTVTILMKQSMGHIAVLFGYILPLFALIAMLIILVSLGVSESVAGLASLSIVALYYTILYLFRKQINKKFTFTLKD
jgi:sigma-E factor negative regulatory protein RseC